MIAKHVKSTYRLFADPHFALPSKNALYSRYSQNNPQDFVAGAVHVKQIQRLNALHP
jgi:hypothetical protein